VVQVEVSVGAPGVIRPATERVELRLPLGGPIGATLVRDNERVQAGQPLLRLGTPDLDERLGRNQTLQREKQVAMDLLERLSTERLAEVLARPSIITGGRSVDLSLPVTRALMQDANQLQVHLETSRAAESKAGTELARVETLASAGIATQRERDDARYALERVQAEARLLVEQARTRWLTQREQAANELAQLQSEAVRLEAERAQATLLAPLAGVFQGLTGLEAGVHVAAGQSFGTISPDDRLLAEILVPSRDIGLIRPGQRVRLQIDALPYTQWGMLEATVREVAADALPASRAGELLFKVLVEPAQARLVLDNGAVGELTKGMTVAARFVTTRRTVLQILYQDASRWLDPRTAMAAGS
jgi:HlyD family secretion protein